jgi:hypothetical protein
VEILRWVCEAVWRKRPEFWPNDWILLHVTAPAKKELSVMQFLSQKSITEVGYPSYSLVLAPNYF